MSVFGNSNVRGRACSPSAPKRLLVEIERVISVENDGALGEHALPRQEGMMLP